MTGLRELPFERVAESARSSLRGQTQRGQFRPLALLRRHWIFTFVAAQAVLVRVIAMAGFRPAVLFRLDSYDYLWGAVHLSPGVVNVSGYSVFLRLLWPLHSLVLVVALQHLMGLGVAVMVYALLRRYGLPGWGATLATAPVLLDPAQIFAEQLVMADVLAMTLMMAGITVLLITRSPSWPANAAAGLLIGASVTVRPTTLPLVVLVPCYLLIRSAGWRQAVGWRRAGAAFAAALAPVLGYLTWFAAVHGTFNLTDSNGLFLWSRTMSFANCAVIKPPPNLSALCPGVQGLGPVVPSLRQPPMNYLWNRQGWQWPRRPAGPVPDTAAFTAAGNDRALRFAAAAITAQPGAYLGVVARESLRPFTISGSSDLRFPPYQPSTSTLSPADRRYAIAAVTAYTGSSHSLADDLGSVYGARLGPPYWAIIKDYQRIVFLPGPVLALAGLAGLAGWLIPRRRTADAAFLWVCAVILMIIPIAEHEYSQRYVLPCVPLICIAAALAGRRPASCEQPQPPQPGGLQ